MSGNQLKTLVPNQPKTPPRLNLLLETSLAGWRMRKSLLVTDADLARAREDPAFRHRLVADSLDLLLTELKRLRAAGADAKRTRQIREGVDLAVKLAELLQRIAVKPPITQASARSRPGAERTAAGFQQETGGRGLMARRPVFPPSQLSSLSRKGSKGLAPGGASKDQGKASSCRSMNTSSSRART